MLPAAPVHPTNTCDPRTGNWAEHLMDLGTLRKKLAARGFESRILTGYYGSSTNPARTAPFGARPRCRCRTYGSA